MVMVFEKEVLRVICSYAPEIGRSECKKNQFYNDKASEWDLQNNGEVVLGLGDFNGHAGRRVDGFEGVHGGYGIGKRNVEESRLLEFCDEKVLCVANTWFEKKELRKITYNMGGNKTEIDFVLIGKNRRKYLKKRESHPLGIATWGGGNRYKQKRVVNNGQIRRVIIRKFGS